MPNIVVPRQLQVQVKQSGAVTEILKVAKLACLLQWKSERNIVWFDNRNKALAPFSSTELKNVIFPSLEAMYASCTNDKTKFDLTNMFPASIFFFGPCFGAIWKSNTSLGSLLHATGILVDFLDVPQCSPLPLPREGLSLVHICHVKAFWVNVSDCLRKVKTMFNTEGWRDEHLYNRSPLMFDLHKASSIWLCVPHTSCWSTTQTQIQIYTKKEQPGEFNSRFGFLPEVCSVSCSVSRFEAGEKLWWRRRMYRYFSDLTQREGTSNALFVHMNWSLLSMGGTLSFLIAKRFLLQEVYCCSLGKTHCLATL